MGTKEANNNHNDAPNLERWVPEIPWLGVVVVDLASGAVVRANRAFFELIGIWITGTLLADHPGLGVAYVLDQTLQHRTMRALRESEERARRFAQASFEGLFLYDMGAIVDTNELLPAMFGTTREEMIGKHAKDFTDPSCHSEEHLVLEAANGVEALRIFRERGADSDLVAPDRPGRAGGPGGELSSDAA